MLYEVITSLKATGMVTGAAGGGQGKKSPAPKRQVRTARAKPAVDAEARRHLIEACAFFHADRFRPAEPGCYRQRNNFV